MTTITLDDKTLCDLECILGGYFAPLDTFMNSKDYEKVCDDLHLEDGRFFPLPVTLAATGAEVKVGEAVILKDQTGYSLASMEVSEVFVVDVASECQRAYGTTDPNHPYVAYRYSLADHNGEITCISGKLTQLNPVRHYDFTDIRLTPNQTKELFKERGWDTVVGFQTRNPMHRAHYELTKYALSKAGENAKLFLNPVVGETQTVDIDYHTRVHVYKRLMPRYEAGTSELGLLPLAMRMAGPREACLHALIRKNYGCTHFVVGRDHAGPSSKTYSGKSFYGPYDAQTLLEKHAGEIGITPITSKMIVYNATTHVYQPIDEVPDGDEVKSLSGTQVREMLRSGQPIPEWFSYPEVVDILRKSQRTQGVCYYFVGLSGSGKTTYANMLKTLMLEQDPGREITILDGDVVRQNLSKGLGFTKEDRSTNVRRIGYVASEIVRHGGTVICANIAPYDEDRLANRQLIESFGGRYVEIFVDTPLEVCEKRDVKGLYKLAREGKIKQFTGISDPFETPSKADHVMYFGANGEDGKDFLVNIFST
uniref:Uncharacterized protein n=1 Tax=viral metagenome TaxID=1070528 RepID=A0A6C0CJ27_9ZZZZ